MRVRELGEEMESTVRWVRAKDLLEIALESPVVVVNGGFDLLHVGHMRVLREARLRAGTLIVALDSDKRVERLKGVGRPVMNWVERAVAIAYFNPDYVVEVEGEGEMQEVMKVADFRVQGSDHKDRPSRFPEVPKFFVRRTGLNISTSQIVERCRRVKNGIKT